MRSRWQLQSLGNPLLPDGYEALNAARVFKTSYRYSIQLRDLLEKGHIQTIESLVRD